MTPEEWEKVSKIFHSALEVPHDKRVAYLDVVCANDATLRDEVESLLFANNELDDFIERPAGTAADAGEMPSLTGAYFGHYRIEGSIGRGGMGEVYLATDTRLNRRVALKKLPDRYIEDPIFVRRFENEAQAAATLNHPNLATIYTVEEYEGKPFITMEYVEGKTLDQMAGKKGLDIQTFLDWFIPLSEGLRHAHERGVIHRDIKPGNLMITTEGVPKILDFGLARVNTLGVAAAAEGKSSTLTNHGQIIGTPSYMSPEQAGGKETDHRTDIFSLGVVMYEALTGRRPFNGESNSEILSELIKCRPEQISSVRADIPRLIARLLMRCLSKRRRDRPRSMQEVATILSEARALYVIGPSTESFGRRIYRETVQSGYLWRIAAVAAVLILAGGLWYYFSGLGRTPVALDKITMRRLSQSNNVGSVTIAPDGQSIVYITVERDARRAMYMRRIDDTNPILLVPPQGVQFWSTPVMSADGGQVYYLTAGRASTHGSIYRISALGGQPRKLVDRVNFFGSVSPDGQRILYVRNAESIQMLSANAADGSGETVVHTSPDANTGFKEPKFSSDGKTIFFVKNQRIDGVDNWSLQSIPAAGGTETEIFRQREHLGEIHPLPGSTALLITSDDPATNLKQVFFVSLPDGKRTRLTNDLNYYRGISVDRAGNIATIQNTEADRVMVGSAGDLSNVRPLTNQPNAFGHVDWTPDERVVFDALENNKAHIWISDISGKVVRLTGGGSEDTQPCVSGDGRFIVFTSNRSGRYQIWRMNIDGINPVLLTNLPGYTEKPRFAADGRTVMFLWTETGRVQVATVPVEGGEVETYKELPGGYSFFWAMSPDGRTIAHTYREPGGNVSKVAVRPVESNTPSIVLDIWPTGFLKWAPDGKSLVYHEREGDEGSDNKLFQIDLVRRTPRVAADTDPESIADIAYSRDGKKVAVVRGRTIADAVMISGYLSN